MENIWVIGGGQFGQRAVEQFKKTAPASQIVLVDCHPLENLPVDIDFICADGVEWLVEHFTPDAAVTRIVPALPVHLAAEWLKQKLLEQKFSVGASKIPEAVFNRLPHPVRLTPDQVLTSHADFLCPPNCSEPDKRCTFTQKPRPQSMYSLLEEMDYGDFLPLIVRSHQFAPGVGGYFPENLWSLLERVQVLPKTPLMIGTACKCHGMIQSILLTNPA